MLISPRVRQLFVIGACQLASLSAGSAMGLPIVLLLQLKDENSSIKLNLDTASWIGSVHGIAGISSIFISAFMQWKGRRTAFMLSCLIFVIGWIIAYTAKSVATLILSEMFHGCGINALSTISYLTMSEMVPPKYRNICVQSYAILSGLGVAVSGILARFLYWRSICLLLCIPSCIALLMSFLWPESPPWLAYQGKFRECEEAFKKLRIMGNSSKRELEELIATQKEKISSKQNQGLPLVMLWSKVKRRDFYLPTIHMFLLLNLTYWSGSAVFVINSLEVMQKATCNDKGIHVAGIISSVVLFIGMSISNILSNRFKNKPIVLSMASCAVVCMIALIMVNILQNFDILGKDSLIGLFFIAAYVFVAGAGLLTVVFVITAEIVPVKYRGIGGSVYIIFTSILYSSSLKASPYLLIYLGVWATYLLFSLNALVCGLLIWRFVPETKNRTLQEIENYYTHGKFIEINQKRTEDDKPFLAEL